MAFFVSVLFCGLFGAALFFGLLLAHQVERRTGLEPLNLALVEGMVDLDLERLALARLHLNCDRLRREERERRGQPWRGYHNQTDAGEETLTLPGARLRRPSMVMRSSPEMRS